MSRPVGICDASGFEYPLNELVRQWDGAYVHRSFLDRRNPQDFVRARAERPALPFSRPEAPDVFIATVITSKDRGTLMSRTGGPLTTRGG